MSLTADKDAAFAIGFLVGSTCSTAYTNQRATQIKVTGAAAKVCVAVSSASKVVQNYRIALTH